MIIKTIKFEPPTENTMNFERFDSNDCLITYDKYGKIGKIELSLNVNIIKVITTIKDKIPFNIDQTVNHIELDYCNEDFTKKYFTTEKSNRNGFAIAKKQIIKIFGGEKDFGLVINLCKGDKILDYVKFSCKCVNIEDGKQG